MLEPETTEKTNSLVSNFYHLIIYYMVKIETHFDLNPCDIINTSEALIHL